MAAIQLVDQAALYWVCNAVANGISADVMIATLDGSYTEIQLTTAKNIATEYLTNHHQQNHQGEDHNPLQGVPRNRTGPSAKIKTAQDIIHLVSHDCALDATFKYVVSDHKELPPVSPLDGTIDTPALMRQMSKMQTQLDKLACKIATPSDIQPAPQQQIREQRRGSLRNQTRDQPIAQQPPVENPPQQPPPRNYAAAAARAAPPQQHPPNAGPLRARRVGGTATATTIRAAPQVIRVAVTKLAPTETPDNIKTYLTSLPVFGNTSIEVEMMNSRFPASYASAKVTFTGSTEADVYKEDVWPERVYVRRWNPPRRAANAPADRLVGRINNN
jgi:hypothetical protein